MNSYCADGDDKVSFQPAGRFPFMRLEEIQPDPADPHKIWWPLDKTFKSVDFIRQPNEVCQVTLNADHSMLNVDKIMECFEVWPFSSIFNSLVNLFRGILSLLHSCLLKLDLATRLLWCGYQSTLRPEKSLDLERNQTNVVLITAANCQGITRILYVSIGSTVG